MISSGCLTVQASLARFVDGVVAPERAQAINRHLEGCPACLEAERIARAIPLMLSSPLHPMAPPALLPRVMEEVDRLRRRNHGWLAAIVAAAVLVIAGVGIAGPRPAHLPVRAFQSLPARVWHAELGQLRWEVVAGIEICRQPSTPWLCSSK